MGADITYTAEIGCTAATFAPAGAALCHGQIVAITDFQSLYSLVGTIFGGDGRVTFGIPDLRGRTPVGAGQGTGLTNVFRGQPRGSERRSVPVPQHNHSAAFTPSGASGGATTCQVTGTIDGTTGIINGDANLNITSSTLSGTASVTGSAPVTGTTPVTLDGAVYVNNNDGAFPDPQPNGALAKATLSANAINMFDSARAAGDVPAAYVEVSGNVPATGKTVDGSGFGIDTSGLSVSVSGQAQTDGLGVTVPGPAFNLWVTMQDEGNGSVTVANKGDPNASIGTIPPQLGLYWFITDDGIYPSRQ